MAAPAADCRARPRLQNAVRKFPSSTNVDAPFVVGDGLEFFAHEHRCSADGVFMWTGRRAPPLHGDRGVPAGRRGPQPFQQGSDRWRVRRTAVPAVELGRRCGRHAVSLDASRSRGDTRPMAFSIEEAPRRAVTTWKRIGRQRTLLVVSADLRKRSTGTRSVLRLSGREFRLSGRGLRRSAKGQRCHSHRLCRGPASIRCGSRFSAPGAYRRPRSSSTCLSRRRQ